MRLVDDQHSLPMVRQAGKLRKIRAVAVHAVKTFDRDPYSTGSTSGTPLQDRVVDGLDVIVARTEDLGPAAAQPIVDTGVNPLVVHHEVATLWSSRKQSEVGRVSAAKIQCGFGAEVRRGSGFQSLVFWMIAAQEARPASPNRYLTCHRLTRGRAQLDGVGKTQIVVGRKIEAAGSLELPTTAGGRQSREIGRKVGKWTSTVNRESCEKVRFHR